jgi:hypothetical protein
MLPEKAREMIDACRKSGYLPNGTRSCLLCSDGCPDEAMFVGVWIADKKTQHRLGAPAEKLANGGGRIILYQLCPSCFERPTRNEDVETEILKRAGIQ